MARVEAGRRAETIEQHPTPRVEIAVEAPGLAKTVSVDSPARPGAVRTAVEKALGDLGLTRL